MHIIIDVLYSTFTNVFILVTVIYSVFLHLCVNLVIWAALNLFMMMTTMMMMMMVVVVNLRYKPVMI